VGTVTVVDALRSVGGCARAKALRAMVGRRAIDAAVKNGSITRDNGAYSVTPSDGPRVLATQLRGVRSHRTAAEHHGLALPPGDGRVSITIPRKAQRTGVDTNQVRLRYRDIPPEHLDGDVTTPLRTVLDCLRDEPLTVALSVGDSALDQGLVTWKELADAVRAMLGPRAGLARERAEMLDARAANAFESCARAILLDAGITGFEPQVTIRRRGVFVGRVDLAHRGLRIVIECDGFQTHGDRTSWTSDLLRHSELVAAGWRPLRVTWELVMFNPEWVVECVEDVIEDVLRTRFAAKAPGRRPNQG